MSDLAPVPRRVVHAEQEQEPAGAPLAARAAVAEAWSRILRERHPAMSWNVGGD